jgi:hypothetical protein
MDKCHSLMVMPSGGQRWHEECWSSLEMRNLRVSTVTDQIAFESANYAVSEMYFPIILVIKITQY